LDELKAPSGNDYTAVSAGYLFGLALKADGTVVGWGNNDYGQRDIPDKKFVAIAAGQRWSLGLTPDGTIVEWGSNTWGEANVPAGRFSAIGAARTGCFSAALEAPAIPEPCTLIVWSLLGASGVGIGWWRRRRAAR
jgi:hypothetical protein